MKVYVHKMADVNDLKRRVLKITRPELTIPEDADKIEQAFVWHPETRLRKVEKIKELLEEAGVTSETKPIEDTNDDYQMNTGVELPADLLDIQKTD